MVNIKRIKLKIVNSTKYSKKNNRKKINNKK